MKHKRLTRGHHGLMRLFFHDEAPRIGCGNRLVDVRIGNCKVRLTDPTTGRRQTIMRNVFDKIEAATFAMSARSASPASRKVVRHG